MPCENCETLRKKIAELEEELRKLTEAYGEAEYYAQQAAHEAELGAARRVRAAETRAREAREEAESAEWHHSQQLRELERARSIGDTWGQERALERLKRGY